jgi:vancomycin resistance protein YoaR
MNGKRHMGFRWGVWIVAWWVLCLAVAAVAAIPVAYQFRYADRIYEGVEVAGIPLGGLTLDEATKLLRGRLATPVTAPVTLRYEMRSWALSSGELGVSVDARATAAAAYRVGRQGDASAGRASVAAGLNRLRRDLTDQWEAWRFGAVVEPILQFDENRLALLLKQIAREVDQPPREGALTFSDAGVTGVTGVPGRLVDVDATRAAIIEVLRNGKGGIVPLIVEERRPAVTAVDAAVAKASALLGHPITLVLESGGDVRRSAVDRATLRAWLKLSPAPGADGALGLAVQMDDARITAHVQGLAKQFDTTAQDASLDYDEKAKQVVVVKPSQTGRAVDVKAATGVISQTLAGLPALAGGAPVTITLPVKRVAPKIDSAAIAELGIKELVTQGTTYFAGSSAERVHNIVNATQKFTGTVIPPGEEFSFNRFIGDITAANGFSEGLIIWGDRTAVGIGGGVCQVSTTVFRAAVQGGFPITERHAHGYVVSWYGEPGLDATIYTPDVDFRFQNDTGAFLLIKPEVDAAKGRITFSFFGTRPDRAVELSKPEISNIRKPEPPIYQEDSSLPRGTIKQVDWEKDGQDVVVKRTIRAADGKVIEDKFVSKYQPWRSVFLFGPGAKLPADAVIGPPVSPTPKP